MTYNDTLGHCRKKLKKIFRRWKYIPRSYTGQINSVKMVILPKTFNIFTTVTSDFSAEGCKDSPEIKGS